jgi:hypothetical protein
MLSMLITRWARASASALLVTGASGCSAVQDAEQGPSGGESCSGTTLERFHSWTCLSREVVHAQISQNERIAGRTPAELLAAYEGVHRAPLYWIADPEIECASRDAAASETELKVTLRPRARCSERQWCRGQQPGQAFYVPVSLELETADGRVRETFEAWIAGEPSSAYISEGFASWGITERPRKLKIQLERSDQGGAVKLRGLVRGWGPTGHFPTACFWKCESEPTLQQVQHPLPAARAVAMVASLRLEPTTPHAGFPLTVEITSRGGHACVLKTGSMRAPAVSPDAPPSGDEPAYAVPVRVRLLGAERKTIALFQNDVVVSRVPGCEACATIVFSGTAPLKLPDLLSIPDRRGITAHVLFAVELALNERGALTTSGRLSLSYLDQQQGERVETHVLRSVVAP